MFETGQTMQNLYLERIRRVSERTGDPRSTLYEKIAAGEFVPPVKIGPKASAWPAHETDRIIAARIAGATVDDIRALVSRLVNERASLPERVGS